MKKKKTATYSEPPKKRGRKKDGMTVKLRKDWEDHEPTVVKRPGARPDVESGPLPDDEASKHAYPPPKRSPIFRKKWMTFIDNVVSRSNFNPAHLDSLEVLCDLYVEYEELAAFVRVNGRSYVSYGRNGETWKFYPEVNQLMRVQAQIKEYTKMLGLLLKKDEGGGASKGEAESWE